MTLLVAENNLRRSLSAVSSRIGDLRLSLAHQVSGVFATPLSEVPADTNLGLTTIGFPNGQFVPAYDGNDSWIVFSNGDMIRNMGSAIVVYNDAWTSPIVLYNGKYWQQHEYELPADVTITDVNILDGSPLKNLYVKHNLTVDLKDVVELYAVKSQLSDWVIQMLDFQIMDGNVVASLLFYNQLTQSTVVSSKALPLASDETPGLMSAETMAKIRRLSEAIAGLDGVVTYLNGKNFETSDLATLQTLLTNYAITEGYTQPLPNSLIVNNWFDGHEYIYNSEDSSWIDYGATTASIATQETAGLIQGSLTKYKVKMESDGTGTVNNLIDLETSVTNHTGNTNNPHAVTKTQVGLGSVDNTADSAKSVSKAATLTTARTIGISGAVTGTATSFNGSANITVPATALAASYLSGTIPAAVLAVTQAATVRNTTIATTAFVGLATRKMWTGAWAAVPDNGGIRTITHSLALTAAQIDGAEIEFDLKCITANRGWAVNDVLKNIALVREGYAYYGNPYKILTNTVTFWAYAACFAFGDYDTVNGNITTEQSGKFQFRIRLFYT